MIACLKCGSINVETERRPDGNSTCLNCRNIDKTILFNDIQTDDILKRTISESTEFRPAHYKTGSDTFAWFEERYSIDDCIKTAEFNIHKYLNRQKNQDLADFKKIADYALWAIKLMEYKK